MISSLLSSPLYDRSVDYGSEFFPSKVYELAYDKTYNKTCATSKDSDQPARSLIRIFVVRMKKAWVPSYTLSAQRRL